MVEGVDRGGSFLATFEISTASESDIPMVLQEEASKNEWTVVRLEEVEFVGDEHVETRSCRALGGRSYFESAES